MEALRSVRNEDGTGHWAIGLSLFLFCLHGRHLGVFYEIFPFSLTPSLSLFSHFQLCERRRTLHLSLSDPTQCCFLVSKGNLGLVISRFEGGNL